jgi:hypothetical protein
MEKISLPTRTVATGTAVVVGLTVLVILLMLGWVGLILYYDVAAPWSMARFRAVVVTGQPIREFRDGEVEREWTLFQEGGRQHALRAFAERAFLIDTWNPEMRYLYARALWREYNSPADASGRTTGGFLHDELPDHVVAYLRMAAVRDPTNCFYRSTLASVLRTTGTKNPEVKPDIRRLLLYYPSQDTYGLIRTAEMLAAEGKPEDKRQVLDDYSRALSFVSTEITSGLVDTTANEPGLTVFPALGPRLVSRAVTGMLRDVGSYDLWSPGLPEYPEVRWLVAYELRTRGMNAEADKEYAKVVELVRRRLASEQGVSVLRVVFEILCPLERPNYADRFLMNRELGLAANVLRGTGRPEEATEMLRVQVSRASTNVAARLALGELLLERAALLRTAARDYRDKGETAKAMEAEGKAEQMYKEVDQQVSAILDRQPLLSEALNLRSRIPKRTPEGAAP